MSSCDDHHCMQSPPQAFPVQAWPALPSLRAASSLQLDVLPSMYPGAQLWCVQSSE